MMNLRAMLVIGLIACAPWFAPGAKAMSIEDFAKMNNDDEAAYVTLLVEGSAAMFKAKGDPGQAAKIIAFFNDSSPDGGVHQFASHLKMAADVNTRNATNPNNRAHVYQVEDVMELILKDHGLIVPAGTLLTIGRNFYPTGPPRYRIIGQ